MFSHYTFNDETNLTYSIYRNSTNNKLKNNKLKPKNITCHGCRSSATRSHKNLIACELCAKVYCNNCVKSYISSEKGGCLCCRKECCCSSNNCSKDHKHCFNYNRSKRRLKAKAEKSNIILNDDEDDISMDEDEIVMILLLMKKNYLLTYDF